MKYLGKITDNKDLVTKEYVDGNIPDISGKQDAIEVDGILEGDGEGNISAATTQEVTTLSIDSAPTQNSNNLVTSGGIYTALQNAGGGSLPTQSGNSGKFLTTDGTDPSWADTPEEVFIATYNTTTYADVLAAYNAGKTLFVKNGSYTAPLATYSSDTFNFYVFVMGSCYRYSVSSTGWTTGTLSFQSSLPSQSGNSGKFLTTNGSALSWGNSPVTSVNTQTGAVVLTASDVGALPDSTTIPTKVSDLTNDSGFISGYTETDPTVPSWAKADSKPSYTASEVGAASSSHTHGNITNGGDITATAPTIASGDKLIINDESASKITNGPSFGTSTTTYLRNDGSWATPASAVTSVNSKTGAVTLSASDVGALPDSTVIPTLPTMDATPTNGNSSNVVSSDGVYDMVMGRTKIYTASCTTAAATAAKVATLDDSTGFSLTAGVIVAVRFTYGNSATTPTLRVDGSATGTAKTIAIPSSATAYTTGNGTTYNTWGAYETVLFTYTGTYWAHLPSGYLGYLAYNLASGAVPQTRTVNSKALSSNITLSASDVGALPDSTSIPTKVSDLTNDSGFISSYTETDPTVPSWAKASSKPSYTASEVGAAPTSHASTATTYGTGTSSNYGHVKLSDSTSSTSSTTGGIAATPAAVKAAYDLANGKQNPLVAGTDYATPGSIPLASTTTPSMDGTASYGSGTSFARNDHVHPTDTSRAPLASPALTGTPTAPTAAAGTNTTQIATTAFVGTALDNRITYGNTDLTAGTSSLSTGVIYLVYE